MHWIQKMCRRWAVCIASALPIAGVLNAQEVVFDDQKLLASDGREEDRFGWSVAISGDRAIVGAPQHDYLGQDSGAAYVYLRDGDTWSQQSELLAHDDPSGDALGMSVAILGDVAVVGAPQDNDAAIDAGAVYVFRFNGTDWIEEQKLIASDLSSRDKFGFAVGITESVIIAGAPLQDGGGAAYVFRFNGTGWDEEQKLIPLDSTQRFAEAVAIHGDSCLIGAHLDANMGAAYFFRHSGSDWVQEQKVYASDRAPSQGFGHAVSLDGETAVIGAAGDDEVVNNAGAAYVLTFDGEAWNEEQKLLAGNATTDDRFGFSTSISGGEIVIGASGYSDLQGTAYRFRFIDDQWQESARFLASDGQNTDAFGSAIAVDGQAAIVGAYSEDGNGRDSGAAYVYHLDSTLDCLNITVDNLVSGEVAEWVVTRATPGRRVAIVYGFEHGQRNVFDYGGYCATFDFGDVRSTRVIGRPVANGDGMAVKTRLVPSGTSGVQIFMQAAEQGTCPNECVSNLLDRIIQ